MGIVPDKQFTFTRSDLNKIRSPIELGKAPLKLLELKPRVTKLVRPPRVVGKTPKMQFDVS